MNDRVGAAFVAMGAPHNVRDAGGHRRGAARLPPGKLAEAADAGDFQLVPAPAARPAAVRVTNLVLPSTAGPYVLLDGGGERFGGNTFLARNANTNGNFLFIMTEGGPGPGVPRALPRPSLRELSGRGRRDARLGVRQGRARSRTGDYFQAPPRNLHGFKLAQAYNRFAAFLTPGIFENFFTRGGNGQNGVGRQAAAARGAAPGGPPAGARGGVPRRRGSTRRSRRRAGGRPRRQRHVPHIDDERRGDPTAIRSTCTGRRCRLPPQDPVWTQGQNRRRRHRARRATGARAGALRRCRSAARSRRSCVARWRSSRRRRISCEGRVARCRLLWRCALAVGISRAAVAAPRRRRRSAIVRDADLRRRATARISCSISIGRRAHGAPAGHRVPARRRLERRHSDDGPGLQALLRAGRFRDGVDRVPPDADRSRSRTTPRT